jgi:DNA-binding IclR family transcriptional regulator
MVMGQTPAGEPAKLTAAGRVLALLGAFSRVPGSLTLSELSRAAGLSLTTTHRLAKEVLDWGGLDVDDNGRYRLSLKFLELASSSTQALSLRERALPPLAELHSRTGLTVQLAMRDGLEAMYVLALRTHPNYTGENRLGGKVRMHVSAAGLVLLAYSGESIEDYLREPLEPYTPNTITDPDTLREFLRKIRENRYAIADQMLATSVGAVAAPVFNPDGSVSSAVGVVYPATSDPRPILDLVRATASRVSHSFLEKTNPADPLRVNYRRHRAGLA